MALDNYEELTPDEEKNEALNQVIERLKVSPDFMFWLNEYVKESRDAFVDQVLIPPLTGEDVASCNVSRGRVQAYEEILQEFKSNE